MCGMILMSLRPPSPPHSHYSSSNSNCLSNSSTIRGYRPPSNLHPQLPATKAVNDLLKEHGKAWRKEETHASSGEGNNDNLLPPFTSFDFPKIEWNFSESDEEHDGYDDMDMSTASAPARLINLSTTGSHSMAARMRTCPRRGSLVRSISLVSSILKEMQRTNVNCGTTSTRYKNTGHKPIAHKRRRPKITTSHHRLVTLEHPTIHQGLQVGHHEVAQKFFL
jgi:hypothetical protein